MPWIQPTTDKAFAQRLSANEKASVLAIMDNDGSADLLTSVINDIRDAIRSGSYPLDADGTIPSGLEMDCYAMFIWLFVTSPNSNAKLQTDARKQANEKAQGKLRLIAEQKYSVESPVAGTSNPAGNFGSNPKLGMRTDSF